MNHPIARIIGSVLLGLALLVILGGLMVGAVLVMASAWETLVAGVTQW